MDQPLPSGILTPDLGFLVSSLLLGFVAGEQGMPTAHLLAWRLRSPLNTLLMERPRGYTSPCAWVGLAGIDRRPGLWRSSNFLTHCLW
jgi:hypothetical protein